MLSDDELVLVARAPGPRVFSANLGAGKPLPVHITAMGRILIAELSTDRLDELLSRLQLESFTPATVTDIDTLREALFKIREHGYAIVDQELEIGFRAIAVPIRDRRGVAIAALGLITNTEQCSTEEIISNILPVIQDAALTISAHVTS